METMAILAGVSTFALLSSTVLAVASSASDSCTVFQIHTTIQGLDGLLSSDKCAEYVSNSSSLSVPCDATSCVAAVENLVSKLPNCTLIASDKGGNKSNKKMELQKGLDECSTNSSSSLSVEAVTSTNPATTSISSSECTSAEASTTAQLYLGAADSLACEQYATMDESSMVVYIYAPCSASQCVSVMETMVQQLPDCYTDGVNLKHDVLKSLASCTGAVSSSSSAADVFPSSASGFPNECTSDEISSLAYLTNSIVTSAECQPYVISTSTEWFIAVPCSATACLTALEDAVHQMPDCEFEGTNNKEELSFQQRACLGSATGSETSGSGDSANSSRTTTPAPDDSSNSSETNASFPSRLCTLSLSTFIFVHAALMLLATTQ